MKYLKTGVTTLFLMVLCYGVTVPDRGAVDQTSKKIIVTTVKKDK